MKLLDPILRIDLIDILRANIDLIENHKVQRFARQLVSAGKYSAATEDEIEIADGYIDEFNK